MNSLPNHGRTCRLAQVSNLSTPVPGSGLGNKSLGLSAAVLSHCSYAEESLLSQGFQIKRSLKLEVGRRAATVMPPVPVFRVCAR